MPQRQAVEEAIAESTLRLLRAGGPRSVTVEAVTADSGVAKTTIYRRHRDRRDMLSAALSRLTSTEPLSTQADAPQRLRWTIRHAIATVNEGIGFGGLASLLNEEDPEFSALFRKILVAQRKKLVRVIDDGRADGTFRADVDAETLIDAMVGAYIAERARKGGVGPDCEDRIFALLWPAVKP
ncbi:TetR/AcrR family transcriptional regulator [Mycolicibacterium pulveris]|uniref:TetR/AcrR family transcriptional regulator n=1 Tax=Mycolicibacterium pulveris TaxID=36813 RepID=UPI003CF98FFA